MAYKTVAPGGIIRLGVTSQTIPPAPYVCGLSALHVDSDGRQYEAIQDWTFGGYVEMFNLPSGGTDKIKDLPPACTSRLYGATIALNSAGTRITLDMSGMNAASRGYINITGSVGNYCITYNIAGVSYTSDRFDINNYGGSGGIISEAVLNSHVFKSRIM